jgi:hypothetical protein
MKTFVLILLALNLSGCATYDWSFNKFHERAQLALDEVRHVRGRVEQGQLP